MGADALTFCIFIAIEGNALRSDGGFDLINAAHLGRRNTKEESMLKLTKGDLAKKTDAQLAAIFQQATLDLTVARSDLASVQSLLAMIHTERATRKPSPQ